MLSWDDFLLRSMIPVCAIFLLILLLAPIAVVLQRGGFSRSYSPGADEMTPPDFLAAPGQMVRTSDPASANNASGEAVYHPPIISSLQSDKPVVAAHIREYDYHEEIPSWAHLSDYVPSGSHHVVHHIVHHVGGTVYSTSGMYDCSMGLHNWRLGWSDDKKVWCCHHDSAHFCVASLDFVQEGSPSTSAPSYTSRRLLPVAPPFVPSSSSEPEYPLQGPVPEAPDSLPTVAFPGILSDPRRAFSCASLLISSNPGDLSAHGTGLGPVDFGPSHSIQASGVALTESGEWGPALPPASVPALLLDLPASASMLLSPLELDVFEGVFFVDDRPTLYPLASEALSLARQWVADDAEALASGYQTAVSELGPPAADPRPAKRAPKAKRPSVAQIALQTAALTEVVAKISTQLAALQQQAGGPTAPQPEPLLSALQEVPLVDSQARLRQSPVSALVPPYQNVPKSLAATLFPPPPVRRAPDPLPTDQVDLDAQMEAAIIEGELPNVQEPGVLASAMMAQSRALLALVGHLAQGGDAVLDSQTSSSSRGAQSRQRLQSELAQLSGAFAEKVRAKAAHRMTPAGLSPTEQASLCRYFERYGGFSRMRETGLIVYQAARAFDLLTAEQPRAAADALGLLLVYLDQLALDSGSTTVAYLMTLLPDPPQGLYAEGPTPPGGSLQAFTPLADQSWVTSALGFLREMDLISTRRGRGGYDPKAAKGGKVGRTEGGSSRISKVSPAGGASTDGSSRCLSSALLADTACTDACDPGGPAPAFEGEFNFSAWAGALPRLVLKSRTAFSHFLFRTLHLQRDEALSVPTALFPLPLPDVFPARSKPRERGGSKRGCGNVRVALHCLVMALNFLHAGFRPPPLDSLRRPPGAPHVAVFKRLVGFLRASCRLGGSIPFCAGRRGTHLVARLGELHSFLTTAGLSDDAYLPHSAAGAAGAKVPHRTDGPDCLRPYRPLDAEGIVLHGSGNWDPTPYLPTSMRLAYLEPSILETFKGAGAPAPSFDQESPDMLLRLLKIWDARSLLQLKPGPLPDRRCTRVFGSFKSTGKFRQIGDRRGQNSYECRLEGVSRELPAGFLLTKLTVPRFSHRLCGSTTDRRDFYTQCRVSPERAARNAVKPCLPLRAFVGTTAFEHYVTWVDSRAGPHRPRASLAPRPALLDLNRPMHGCFQALFQGDASGVEFATAAHVAFLEDTSDLQLPEKGRIVAGQPLTREGPWAGVIIDDAFSISVEEAHSASHQDGKNRASEGHEPPDPSSSERMILKAWAAYERAGILGSPEKDTLSEDVFVIGGAQVDSSPASVREGLVQVGTPIQKRLSLSLASLKLAGYRTTTEELTSMISGAWVSALLFRRCAMSCLGKLFGISVKEAPGPDGSKLVALPSAVRQELCIVSVLAPVLATNVAAPFLQEVFASDASMKRGAYVKAPASVSEASALWLAADTKGFYTMLDLPARAALASVGAEPLDLVASPPPFSEPRHCKDTPLVPKPVGQFFDFLEVGPGPASLCQALAARGFSTGPHFDCSVSPHFDLLRLDAYDWLLFMIQARRLRGLMLHVPTGALASPGPRGKASYTPSPRVRAAQRFASRAFGAFWSAWRANLAAALVVPFRSKVRASSLWRYLCSLEGITELPGRSLHGLAKRGCSNFCLLLTGLPAIKLAAAPCGLPAFGGSLARAESKLPAAFEAALEEVFCRALRDQAVEPAPRAGLESLLVNDLLAARSWSVSASWVWRETAHINLLETRAYLKALRDLAKRGDDARFVHIVDSAARRPLHCFDLQRTEAGSSVAQETTSHKAWLAERGRSLENFLSENPPEVQALNTSLVAYGRELYDAGRHQAARVEPQDLVELIDLVFHGLRSDERLWPRLALAEKMRETWESFLEDALHPDDLEVLRGGFRAVERSEAYATFFMNCWGGLWMAFALELSLHLWRLELMSLRRLISHMGCTFLRIATVVPHALPPLQIFVNCVFIRQRIISSLCHSDLWECRLIGRLIPATACVRSLVILQDHMGEGHCPALDPQLIMRQPDSKGSVEPLAPGMAPVPPSHVPPSVMADPQPPVAADDITAPLVTEVASDSPGGVRSVPTVGSGLDSDCQKGWHQGKLRQGKAPEQGQGQARKPSSWESAPEQYHLDLGHALLNQMARLLLRHERQLQAVQQDMKLHFFFRPDPPPSMLPLMTQVAKRWRELADASQLKSFLRETMLRELLLQNGKKDHGMNSAGSGGCRESDQRDVDSRLRLGSPVSSTLRDKLGTVKRVANGRGSALEALQCPDQLLCYPPFGSVSSRQTGQLRMPWVNFVAFIQHSAGTEVMRFNAVGKGRWTRTVKNLMRVSWSHSKRTWCCLHDNPEYCGIVSMWTIGLLTFERLRGHWSDFEKKWCDWHNDKHYDVHPFYHGIDHSGYPMHHKTYTYHYGSSHHPAWWYGLGHDQPIHPYYSHHVVYETPEEGLPEEVTPEEGLPKETAEGETVPEEGVTEETPEGGIPAETVEGETVPAEGVTEETPEGGIPAETVEGEAVPDEAATVDEQTSEAGPADTVAEK
ncbi:hypothetical protein AK812_SmicGene24713 [Symbiodinium microadriaticum]|uniref:Uncharacterized protein n=1 Tax=Symbiodinium microadriaticum TaxID=2951 RepID=A0A1Q9DDT9_SYMMI|nr:hypothetical protein AK812_SmicGene24713 [Symbiodinium microadriaticum]